MADCSLLAVLELLRKFPTFVRQSRPGYSCHKLTEREGLIIERLHIVLFLLKSCQSELHCWSDLVKRLRLELL